jgi:phage FluMu protein Com
MSEINIAGAILIYDDPEYCESRERSCDYCHGLGYCKLFRSKLEEKNSLEIKCPQCKAVYQKAKQQQKKT